MRSTTGLSFSLGKVSEKRANQKRNIFFPLAQRRHRDAHDVEPKVQIVAEFSFLHQLFEILVRRRDQAHIRAQSLIAADALEGALFADHAQQFHLRAAVDLADFIEKNSAAVRLLEAADPAFMRAGERAFFVPEQFALQQLSAKARRNAP